MRIKHLLIGTVSSCLLALIAQPSLGQLYSQDFDVDDTSNWTVNIGQTDTITQFFFDYSTVGVPSAPNSTGSSTRGLRLQANQFSNAFGGVSVSPTGESFSGDYVLSYDMWQSYQGVTFVPAAPPFPVGGGIIRGQSSGGTQIGYGGILTSGTAVNEAGASDAVFFAATNDGDSGADYRAYSSDKPVSYQPNALLANDPGFDARELSATYFAEGGSAPADFDGDSDVDGSDFLTWQRGFGLFDGSGTVAEKTDGDAHPAFTGDGVVDALDLEAWEYWHENAYKTRNSASSTLYTDNFGGENATAAQAADPRWADQLVIDPANVTDVGVIAYAWREHTITKVGNVVTWAVDGIDLIQVDTTDFATPVGGSNILFGHADTNSGSSANPEAFDLLFTLVDNIRVDAIPSTAVGVNSVPEPATGLIAIVALLFGSLFSRRRLATQLVSTH